MGILEGLFGKKTGQVTAAASHGDVFETLTAYRPAFKTWGGQMYESELIRAVVDTFARHVSKLKVEFNGPARGALKTAVKAGPNEWQTWSQFLYRTATIFECCNTAFIVPVFDPWGEVNGYYPVLPTACEVVDVKGEAWLRYTFASGKKAAIELKRCGMLTKHQFKNDFFGETNSALNGTLGLLDMQQQGIVEGVKNSATFRFMARLNNFAKPDDLAKERTRFNKENLQGESGGILLFPNTYMDVKQIESKPYVVDAAQMELIKKNVFDYFGSNEDVLQSKTSGDAMNAYFDAKIEPFMIQLSEQLTRMTYTAREIGTGNKIEVTANRLQYMNTDSKLKMAEIMMDRGAAMIDEIRELFNYAPLPDGLGQHIPARGEYYMLDQGKDAPAEEPTKTEEDDE